LRSQAIRRAGRPRFLIRCAGQWQGRGPDDLPLGDLWKYIINGNLSELRSTRGGPSVQTRTERTATGHWMPAMRWAAAARASEVAGSTRPVPAVPAYPS